MKFYSLLLVWGILHVPLLMQEVYSQNNSLVINNNAYIVLSGGSSGTPIYVVVDQPNQAGITTLGTGGNIISENEYNYVKWNISNSTGIYTVPLTTGVGVTESKIPLQMQITTAGTSGGSVLFSTYETNDMNQPWSSQVTHMNDAATGSSDNSLYVVDRFWQIDASSYGTKPAVAFNFGYNTDATETGGTNLLTVGNLGAQRFNNVLNKWEGWFGGPMGIWGTDNGSGSVGGVVVPSTSFYRTWTLADYSSPLPIELISFTAECNKGKKILEWVTASESNNDYFIIERSENGIDFYQVGIVDGAGNSTSILTYNWTDDSPSPENSYYRLTQVDFNGKYSNSEIISSSSCEEDDHNIYVSSEGIVLNIYTDKEKQVDFYLIDMSGRIVGDVRQLNLTRGDNNFVFSKDVATGVYSAVLAGKNEKYTTKLYLK